MVLKSKGELRDYLKNGPDKFSDKGVDRFLAKIDDSDGPKSCWEWKGVKNSEGYGYFQYKGGMKRAHRLVCKAVNNNKLVGLQSLHSCDNPKCCNPNHLSFGTHRENVWDRERKGRGVIPNTQGEANGQAKLTEADICAIRVWLQIGYTQQSIADAFGVHRSIIGRIKTGEIWTHVPNETPAIRHRRGWAPTNSHENPLHSSL